LRETTTLREEAHAIAYAMGGGVTLDNIETMPAEERDWWINRIAKQQKAEADAIRRAGKK